MGVFSLTGWSRQIQTGFLVSRPTQDTATSYLTYVYVPFTLYGSTFQKIPLRRHSDIAVLRPRYCRNNIGLGCFHFARHYFGNHGCFLLLRLLRCFSSAGLPTSRCDWPPASRVAPFGYPRINSRLLIPEAFRSLPRPSSPPRAQASPRRSFLLSLFVTYPPFARICDLFSHP